MTQGRFAQKETDETKKGTADFRTTKYITRLETSHFQYTWIYHLF